MLTGISWSPPIGNINVEPASDEITEADAVVNIDLGKPSPESKRVGIQKSPSQKPRRRRVRETPSGRCA